MIEMAAARVAETPLLQEKLNTQQQYCREGPGGDSGAWKKYRAAT